MVCVKLKHGHDPDSKFDPKQLKDGIKVELEHTYSRAVAKQIAKAHLVENPNYYTYLERMEKSWHQKKHVRRSKTGKLFTAGKRKTLDFLKWQRKNRRALIKTLDKANDPLVGAVNTTFKVEDKFWDKVIQAGGKKYSTGVLEAGDPVKVKASAEFDALEQYKVIELKEIQSKSIIGYVKDEPFEGLLAINFPPYGLHFVKRTHIFVV